MAFSSKKTKDLEIMFINEHEVDYSPWCNKERILRYLLALPENAIWNTLVCTYILCIIVLLSALGPIELDYFSITDFTLHFLVFDGLYTFHVLALVLNDYQSIKLGESLVLSKCAYLIDVVSITYRIWVYALMTILEVDELTIFFVGLACYSARLHRPFRYLGQLNDYSLKGSILGTLLKYIYTAASIIVIYANVLIFIGQIPYIEDHELLYFQAFYATNKLFIPIGPDSHPINDTARLWYMIVMLSGCLLVLGITVASLSLIIGIYMRPEEIFRSRFRLIMNDMKTTNIPIPLREKVETFYRMFWHKQKAVSKTRLLPTYPPSLINDIRSNIYFRAQQKSRVLFNLSSQFLSEVSKYMETINYIPGDSIIKRNTSKSCLIFITYGDIELLSAEDDETPLLRFTRGTIKNPCGVCVEIACTRSHVAIRAATFCTAHVLKAADLWRVTCKYGKNNGQSFILHSSMVEHLDIIKNHYARRVHLPYKYKSNIIQLKQTLIDLKEAVDDNGELLIKRADFFLNINGCYIMRNQSDLSITEESDEICLRPTFPCILQPKSSLLFAWNTFIAVLTLVVVVVHPYNMVYLKTITTGFRFFDYVVSMIYIVDMIVRLSTGTKVEEGVPLTLQHTSSQQMKSYWFADDIFSVLPIFEFVGDGRLAGLNKLLKLPVIFRILKQLEDECVYQSNILRLFSYCLLIMILTYLVASLQQGFGCFYFGYCLVNNFTHEPFWVQEPLNDNTTSSRFTFSIYWAISMVTFTTHKTAQMTKALWQNQLFVLVILEVCIIFHVMIESTYSATIMVTETMRDRYNSCIGTVRAFFSKNNVDPELTTRFINYLQLCWFTDKAYTITNEKDSILFDLPEHVYQDLLTKQRSKYVLRIPFMKFLSNEDLKKVSSEVRFFYVAPNEILLNTGDISNEIYVIKQGMCEVLDPLTKEPLTVITSKNYFGDVECLLRLPAYNTVRAVTHVRVFSISRKSLSKVFTNAKIMDAINYAKKLPEYAFVVNACDPFAKYTPLPPAPNREFFPMPRKHEPDYAYLHPFHRLGFMSILRYVFPRFTIRPDGQYLKRYEWFRAACALTAANIYPVFSFLEMQFPFLWHVTWVLDICAYFDIIQRMLIGYFNVDGILVYHPASTAAHYIRGAFLVDLLACLPLEYLDYVRKTIYFEDNAYRYPSTTQYLMYNRLFQLYRVPSALTILDDCIERQDIILIIKAFPFLMSMFMIITSLLLELTVEKWKPVSGGWRLKVVQDPMHGNWIDTNGKAAVRYNITETPLNLVLTAFYWVVYETTSTGFNIFQPGRLSMMHILILGMLLGLIITKYFSVRVISIRANVNYALASFQEHMTDIIKFMKKEGVDKKLQREMIHYYEFIWTKMGGTKYRNILKLCKHITLRTDAILHIYGKTFNTCPLMSDCDISFLRVIGRAVDSQYLPQGMTLIERNDVIRHMYFVDYGIMEMHDSNDDDYKRVSLERGSVFGNLENMKTVVCPNKFVASTNLHLLKINAETFYKIIQDFPAVKGLLKMYRPHNENYIKSEHVDEAKRKKSWDDDFISSESKLRKILSAILLSRKYMQIYLVIVGTLCIYGDLYNAGFQDNRPVLIGLLYLLDVLFLFKIVRKCFLPYITEKETETRQTLTDKKNIYFTSTFKIDIMSCIPIELLCCLTRNPWEVFAFLRLNRLIRGVVVYRCLQRYHENVSINLTIATVFSVFIWFTIFVHSSACIWYYLGVLEDFYEPYSSWRYRDNKTSVCDDQYICSLYFILTTFTQNGVGDILPKQKSEVAFVCALMISSTIIFMIYVGEFSSIIQYRSFRYYSFYTKYLELLEFLRNNRVAANLVTLTEKYTLHLWQEGRGHQMPQFLEKAPYCLRLNIMDACYMHHLTSHPVFAKCEPAFLRQVVGHFHLFLYKEDMTVVKEGEITNSMYFVHTGRVQELDEDLDEKSEIFTPGKHFGTVQGLNRDVAYTISYRTIIQSKILSLSLDEWEYLLYHFPTSKSIIYKNQGGPHSSVFVKADNNPQERTRITSTLRIRNKSALAIQSESFLLSPSELHTTSANKTTKATGESAVAAGDSISGVVAAGDIATGSSPTTQYTNQKITGLNSDISVDISKWPLESRHSIAFSRNKIPTQVKNEANQRKASKHDTSMKLVEPSSLSTFEQTSSLKNKKISRTKSEKYQDKKEKLPKETTTSYNLLEKETSNENLYGVQSTEADETFKLRYPESIITLKQSEQSFQPLLESSHSAPVGKKEIPEKIPKDTRPLTQPDYKSSSTTSINNKTSKIEKHPSIVKVAESILYSVDTQESEKNSEIINQPTQAFINAKDGKQQVLSDHKIEYSEGKTKTKSIEPSLLSPLESRHLPPIESMKITDISSVKDYDDVKSTSGITTPYANAVRRNNVEITEMNTSNKKGEETIDTDFLKSQSIEKLSSSQQALLSPLERRYLPTGDSMKISETTPAKQVDTVENLSVINEKSSKLTLIPSCTSKQKESSQHSNINNKSRKLQLSIEDIEMEKVSHAERSDTTKASDQSKSKSSDDTNPSKLKKTLSFLAMQIEEPSQKADITRNFKTDDIGKDEHNERVDKKKSESEESESESEKTEAMESTKYEDKLIAEKHKQSPPESKVSSSKTVSSLVPRGKTGARDTPPKILESTAVNKPRKNIKENRDSKDSISLESYLIEKNVPKTSSIETVTGQIRSQMHLTESANSSKSMLLSPQDKRPVGLLEPIEERQASERRVTDQHSNTERQPIIDAETNTDDQQKTTPKDASNKSDKKEKQD